MFLWLTFRHSHASSWHYSAVGWAYQDPLSGNTMSWRPNRSHCGKTEAYERILQLQFTLNYFFPCNVFTKSHSWSSCHQSQIHVAHVKEKKKSLKIFLKTSLGMNSNGLYCLQDKAQITSQALGEQTLTHLSCPFPHHFPLWILHSAIGIFELFLKVFQNFASHMLIPPPRMVFMTYSSGKLWLTLQDYGQDFLSITSQTTNSG